MKLALKITNAHLRDKFISFNQADHTYTHSNGRVFTRSVTGFTRKYFPFTHSFDANKTVFKMLPIWAANENSKYFRLIQKFGYPVSSQVILKLWEENRNEACNVGTAMHQAFENHLNGDLNVYCNSELADDDKNNKNTINYENDDFVKILVDSKLCLERVAIRTVSKIRNLKFEDCCCAIDVSDEVKILKRWIKEHPELTPYRTEWSIFSEELDIAGQIDAVFKRGEGELVLVDWKRTDKFFDDTVSMRARGPFQDLPDSKFGSYCAQLKVYKTILEKEYDMKVSDMLIVQIHPSFGFMDYKVR